MKKSIIFAFFIMLAVSLSAQHVSPISFSLTEFNLDSLRTQYDGASYLLELQRLDKLLKDDTKTLKDAQSQFKDEKDYYKQMTVFVDKTEDSFKNLQALAHKESDELNSLKDIIDKQLRSLNSIGQLNADTRKKVSGILQVQRNGADSAINATTIRLTQIANHLAQLRQARTDLMVFNSELTNKETDLKQIETALKMRRDIIKSETKDAKAKK